MADRKAATDRKPSERKSGKFHYNPGNMSGKEAGIVEEVREQENRGARHRAPDRNKRQTKLDESTE